MTHPGCRCAGSCTHTHARRNPLHTRSTRYDAKDAAQDPRRCYPDNWADASLSVDYFCAKWAWDAPCAPFNASVVAAFRGGMTACLRVAAQLFDTVLVAPHLDPAAGSMARPKWRNMLRFDPLVKDKHGFRCAWPACLHALLCVRLLVPCARVSMRACEHEPWPHVWWHVAHSLMAASQLLPASTPHALARIPMSLVRCLSFFLSLAVSSFSSLSFPRPLCLSARNSYYEFMLLPILEAATQAFNARGKTLQLAMGGALRGPTLTCMQYRLSQQPAAA